MIEITRFRLLAGADAEQFLSADKLLQENFAYRQPGLLRRTTARSEDGGWIVIDVWASPEHADACALRWDSDETVERFMSFVDRQTFAIERFATVG